MAFSKDEVIQKIKDGINEEAKCLNKISDEVDFAFYDAALAIKNCQNRVIITGVGKSGHVGKKIAASFASLGIPSFFVHSDESLHGDLGMITKNDVVIMISNSGKTKEVLGMLPSIGIIGAKTISITKSKDTPLAQKTDIALVASVDREIDNLNLAPTASTVAVMAVGDALASVVSEMKGFKTENFALFHPAGALGQKLIKEYQESIKK